MFTDMFNSLEKGEQPMETFYDGYVINCIMDACYRSAKSKKWEPVKLEIWRGKDEADDQKVHNEFDSDHWLIKEERLPDGRKKVILKNKKSGKVSEKLVSV